MYTDLLFEVTQILEAAGFKVIDSGAEPMHFTLRDKQAAFIHLSSVSLKDKGFEITSGKRHREYVYDIECLLLGAMGDCSDRGVLEARALSAVTLMNDAGFDARVESDEEIDGKLSRAKCILKLEFTVNEITGGE